MSKLSERNPPEIQQSVLFSFLFFLFFFLLKIPEQKGGVFSPINPSKGGHDFGISRRTKQLKQRWPHTISDHDAMVCIVEDSVFGVQAGSPVAHHNGKPRTSMDGVLLK
jgi:hypothetical protein